MASFTCEQLTSRVLELEKLLLESLSKVSFLESELLQARLAQLPPLPQSDTETEMSDNESVSTLADLDDQMMSDSNMEFSEQEDSYNENFPQLFTLTPFLKVSSNLSRAKRTPAKVDSEGFTK